MTLLETNEVPNQFPSIGASYRIAVVGEAPGKDEEMYKKPFVGASGDFLTGLLQDAGIQRDACFIGNICQVRPPDNKLDKFKWAGPEIRDGLAALTSNLLEFKPNITIALGGYALHALKTKDDIKRKPKYSIGNWRGSLFLSNGIVENYKCISTFHPAALLRQFGNAVLTRFDLRRARREAESPILNLTERNIVIEPDFATVVLRLKSILERKPRLAVDIEGSGKFIRCIAFAESPMDSICIPFEKAENNTFISYWTFEEEVEILRLVRAVLESPEIEKVFQNGGFDCFCIAKVWGFMVLNFKEDIMFKHWEWQSEIPKGLEVTTSIYTREPYYAGDIVVDDESKGDDYWSRIAKVPNKDYWRYNALDSAVTREIDMQLDRLLVDPKSQDHYKFNMALTRPIQYMQLKGIRYDTSTVMARRATLEQELETRQQNFETKVGHPLNVKSHVQMKKWLYEELKLPEQHVRGKVDEDGNQKTTSNYEAILNLYKKSTNPLLMECIRPQEVRKRISDINSIRVDLDGRVRFSYNIVGSETGRITCFGSPTGSGCNGQTITSSCALFESEAMNAGLRDLFLADEGFRFAQMDLAGADGWTVAAWCAKLGDPTMLEDLLFGLKVPMLIAMIVKHGVGVNALDRATLKKKCAEEIDKKGHLYFSCKQVQHGTNYGMKPKTVALRVLLESYGEVSITDKQAEQYQNAYLSRYRGVLHWHDHCRNQLRKYGYLLAASGQKRIFNGRRSTEDTLREYLSHEPQANTTFVTNRALLRLWRDVENRGSSNEKGTPTQFLRIQPLHQVHDALCCQFRNEDTDWAVNKIKSYFDEEIVIAGIPIKIPFEGEYGDSWGSKGTKI